MTIRRNTGKPKTNRKIRHSQRKQFHDKTQESKLVRTDASQTKPNDAEFVEVSAAALGAKGFLEGNNHAGDAVSEKVKIIKLKEQSERIKC
jgi:hypothetical protein